MVTYYATHADISDFLRIAPFTACTTPTIAQIEKIINRVEERIDKRTGHTYGRTKTETEIYDVPMIYTFGHGLPIFLKHREVKTAGDGLHLNAASGDKLELWEGGCASWSDVTANTAFYDVE